MPNSTGPQNARSLVSWNSRYYEINREERNLAAILYAALLKPGNLNRFLDLIESKLPLFEREAAVYYEYAYLRDLWNQVAKDNSAKRNLILGLLKPANAEELSAMSIEAFNNHFGVAHKPSKVHIESPGNWSVLKFTGNIADDQEFLKTCRFKWAFNIKPDIVIHTFPDAAVCIEAKYASGEGSYPTSRDEKAEFNRRGLDRVGQTQLQQYMMEELLGIRTEFVFLVQSQRAKSDTHKSLLWRDAFSTLDMEDMPGFVTEWISRL